MTPAQIAAVRMIADAIVDAVKAAGAMGAPGGVLYAALMAYGISLSQFESLMSAMVSAGKLTKHGHLYRVVE
jgi:hypothetical protein